MLRFSVDFLWISVSKWTVKFSLCLRQKCYGPHLLTWVLPQHFGLHKMIYRAFL